MSEEATPSLKKLYLRFTTYERPSKPSQLFSFLYFSFRFLGQQYFSSQMPQPDPNGRLLFEINDHFLFVLDSQVSPQEPIEVTRWEDHLSVFTFTIELGQLLSKQFLRRRMETKPEDYINISLALMDDKELLLLDRKTNEIAHYYIIDKFDVQLTGDQPLSERASAPAFISLLAGKKKYTLPDGVHNRCVVVQLPTKLMFEYHREGQLVCRSEVLDSGEYLRRVTKIGMANVGSGGRGAYLQFEGRWGYNLSSRSEMAVLWQAQQVNLYDFEIVFEKENQYPDTKMKIICGNKLFELAADSYNGKKMKFRKLVHLFLKSEDEQIIFRLEKNHIEYCNLRLFTEELHGFEVVRKKLNDSNTGKQVGGMRFRSEKDRNVSLPENNKLWRESLKKRFNHTYLLALEQLSYYFTSAGEQQFSQSKLKFSVNMGSTISPISDIICLSHYSSTILAAHQDQQVSLLNVREEASICLAVQVPGKSTGQSSEAEVQCLGVVDLNSLHLGMNCLEVALYQQKTAMCYVNLLINKVPNLQLCKSDYQPQILGRLKKKTRNISVEVSAAKMNCFLYTYEYENKSELYCIVEINRQKKVLLLEREGESLGFVQGEGSDYLNFVVQEMEYLRVKLTFLIADLGFEEEIYGSVSFKCRFVDLLTSGNISFAQTNIKNEGDVVVGGVSARLVMGDVNRNNLEQGMSMKILKHQLERGRKSRAVEIQSDRNPSVDAGTNRYASIEKQHKSEKYSHKELSVMERRNSLSLKLPALTRKPYLKPVREIIKEAKQAKEKLLHDPGEVKEAPKNEQEEAGMDDTILKLEKEVQKNRRIFAMNRLPHKKKSVVGDSAKPPPALSSDPNVQHNFDMLFPDSFKRMKKSELKQKINDYEARLKGLKSILKDIKIPDVEAEKHYHNEPKPTLAGPASIEFQDNEFMAVDASPL